jgi:hypothetical protein
MQDHRGGGEGTAGARWQNSTNNLLANGQRSNADGDLDLATSSHSILFLFSALVRARTSVALMVQFGCVIQVRGVFAIARRTWPTEELRRGTLNEVAARKIGRVRAYNANGWPLSFSSFFSFHLAPKKPPKVIRAMMRRGARNES